MKKILTFSGSNSSKSINQALVTYAGNLVKSNEVTLINLRDYDMPLFSLDLEEELGKHENAIKLRELFEAHDGFIISLPEHNSSMSAFFKNTIDWISRTGRGPFGGKPILLLSASPGPGAGKRVLEAVEPMLAGFLAGNVVAKFGLGTFHDSVRNTESGIEIIDEEDITRLQEGITTLELAVEASSNDKETQTN